ncbi:MAG: methyltransferase domain-containing protein [Planctomycetia bacterium]
MPSRWSVAQSRSPELMDDPAIDAREHLAALRALGTINALSRTASSLARAITRLVASGPSISRPLRVVDVACGGGDVTVALARRLGPSYHVTGIDLSPRAIARADEHAATRRAENVSFAACDVLASGCPDCDVAVTSLFLHHLDDGAAVATVQSLARAAAVGGVVSDLVRSRRGLVLAHLATRVLTRSRVAQVDGPLSVRAARTLPEYRLLMDRVGIPAARIAATWPERVLITWHRPRAEARP